MASRNWELVIYLFSTSTIAGGFENARKLTFHTFCGCLQCPHLLVYHLLVLHAALEGDVNQGKSASSALPLHVPPGWATQDQLPYLLHHWALPFTYYVLFLLYFSLSFPSPTSIFSILNVFIINWRTIAWQYSAGFYYTTWISHGIYVPSLLETYSHLPSHTTPLGCKKNVWFWANTNSTGSLSYIWRHIDYPYTLSVSPTTAA